MQRIEALHGGQAAPAGSKEWFGMRTKAIKNIIGRMSDAEKSELDARVSELAEAGYPAEERRR